MSAINYLRGVVMRDRPLAPPAPPPAPPREIPWANAVRTVGACTHDVIYGSCNCDQGVTVIERQCDTGHTTPTTEPR